MDVAVVVADCVYYYELGKRTATGEERRPQQFNTNRLLFDRARAYEKSEWKDKIGVDRPDEAGTSKIPEAHFGVIASGEKVLADQASVDLLLKEHPKIIAIAMEGAGVARAAQASDPPPGFIEIRGISDLADRTKDDAITRFAPDCKRIHLLYAGPVSLGFHLGQQISANIHPPVLAWNFRRGTYDWGIDLAAASAGRTDDAAVHPANG